MAVAVDVGRCAAVAFVVAAMVARAGSAAAQGAEVAESRDFSVERFRWSFARSGVLGAESAAIPEAGSWDLGLWLGTANDPLVLVREEPSGARRELASLVAQRSAAALLVSYTPWRRLELGLELPLVLAQSRSSAPPGTTAMLDSIAGAGLGDARLAGKLGVLRAARAGVDVAVLLSLSLPSSGGQDYRGERGVALAPELLISRQLGATRLAANAGYRARQNAHLLDLDVVDELYGVAAVARGFELGAGGAADRLEAALGLSLATAAVSPLATDNQDHLEALGGVTWDAGPLVLSLIGGAGLHRGFGTPDWRGVLAVRFGEVRGVGDGDDDDAGRGKRYPEPPDRVLPPDLDGDGVRNLDDRCPDDPETKNGVDDADGCPDAVVVSDGDGDGVADGSDLCPADPEDLDGFQDDDGCPDPDNDSDGVADRADACPGERGPAENRGCPDQDRDEDGVVDRLDNCPDEAGAAANSGCKKKQLVTIVEGKLILLDIVYFDHDRDRLQPRSYPLLDNVAAVIASHPELTRVEVEGHTDDAGDAAYNKDLSQRRAAAVVRYLESKLGARLVPGRLHPIGYGEERPVTENRTAAGRAKNRRVEFKLTSAVPGGSGSSSGGSGGAKVYDFPDEVLEGETPKPPAPAPAPTQP